MGHTITNLYEKKIEPTSIFDNRFVIEICERVHVHYRNLRTIFTLDDFITIAEAYTQALDRWKRRGCPGTGEGKHIELCRKKIVMAHENDKIQINLNHNLYNNHKDEIFSEGANFTDGSYIHLKVKEHRFELSIDEFKELSNAVIEANKRLEAGGIPVGV